MGADGDYVAFGVSAGGRQWVSALVDTALPAGTNNIGDVDVLTVPADPFGVNADAASATGSISAKLRFIAGTGIPITGTVTVGAHAVTNAGTFAVQVDGAALTSLQLIDDTVFVDEATFTPATNKLLATGALAVAHGADPDTAAAGGIALPIANRHRVPFMIGGHPNVITAVYNTTAVQIDDQIVAVAAGSKAVVTRLDITMSGVGTVAAAVLIGFGATTLPALGASGADAVAGLLASHPNMLPGAQYLKGDGAGILGVGADDADIRITCAVPTGGRLDVIVSYYLVPS